VNIPTKRVNTRITAEDIQQALHMIHKTFIKDMLDELLPIALLFLSLNY